RHRHDRAHRRRGRRGGRGGAQQRRHRRRGCRDLSAAPHGRNREVTAAPRTMRRAVSDAEKEQRRDDILAAAKKVFSKKGFASTTIADVAKAAHLSYGSI